nr:hypothetical protein [Tanacetum cinerariifolium]
DYASWDLGQMHMGRSRQGVGTVPVSCRCTGDSMGVGDESVHSKPYVTKLYVVKDEAFIVDKKYVNVTDLNLAYDEKVSISDRDDLEKKIDDVQVLDNVVCVDPNNVTVYDVFDEDVEFAIKEVGSNNVDVNEDEDVAGEDVDLAGQNVFVADQKSFLDVEFAQNNYVVFNCSDVKREESDDVDMNNCSDTP